MPLLLANEPKPFLSQLNNERAAEQFNAGIQIGQLAEQRRDAIARLQEAMAQREQQEDQFVRNQAQERSLARRRSRDARTGQLLNFAGSLLGIFARQREGAAEREHEVQLESTRQESRQAELEAEREFRANEADIEQQHRESNILLQGQQRADEARIKAEAEATVSAKVLKALEVSSSGTADAWEEAKSIGATPREQERILKAIGRKPDADAISRDEAARVNRAVAQMEQLAMEDRTEDKANEIILRATSADEGESLSDDARADLRVRLRDQVEDAKETIRIRNSSSRGPERLAELQRAGDLALEWLDAKGKEQEAVHRRAIVELHGSAFDEFMQKTGRSSSSALSTPGQERGKNVFDQMMNLGNDPFNP